MLEGLLGHLDAVNSRERMVLVGLLLLSCFAGDLPVMIDHRGGGVTQILMCPSCDPPNCKSRNLVKTLCAVIVQDVRQSVKENCTCVPLP